MIRSKNLTFQVKRNGRRHFCKIAQRSFGLECLEKRTVFANDLPPFLDDVGGFIASTSEETRPTPFVHRTVEVSHSPLSLLQGDILRFQVPASILLQLTDRDSYQLQVFYSENYFSYEPNMLNLGSTGSFLGSSGSDELHTQFPLGHTALDESTSRVTGHQEIFASAQTAANASPNERNASSGDFSAILLASLTASSDFEGHVRFLDWVQDPYLLTNNTAIAELPNEVRIEPRVTIPTAMRDPGATLVTTIMVNRAPNGVMVAAGNDRAESSAKDEAANMNGHEASTATSQTDDAAEQRRSVVTLKTIDISMIRRNEPSRPWMRSASIPNPTAQRDSVLKHTASESATVASAPHVKSEAESNKPTRRELRVPGTKLQPVEFHLAASIGDHDDLNAMDADQIREIDQAISYYSENDSFETWRETGLFPASFLTSNKSVSGPHLEVENQTSDLYRDGKSMLAQLTDLYFSPMQGVVASHKETWKNAVRTASESVAGQAMLASLTTLAVHHRDINAFGTKSAWEFVIKKKR